MLWIAVGLAMSLKLAVKHRDGRWYRRRGGGGLGPLIGGPRSGPPINGMDQAVLDQEGDMNTFNKRIYRITAHNFI